VAGFLAAPRDLVGGFAYVVRGARMLRAERALWPLASVPALITALCLVWVPRAALARHAWLMAWLWAPGGGREGWFGSVAQAAHGLVSTLVWLALLFASVVVAAVVASTLSAPANDLLSERIEERATGRPVPPFSLARSLREAGRVVVLGALRTAIYAAVISAGWLLAWVVPGPGHLLQLALSLPITLGYLALDQVDYAAARRAWSVRERLGLLWSEPAKMLGFGAGVWLLLCIPLLNVVFAPVSVTGGTLLVLELQRHPRSA
jgi:uncharacterized protein involved in cysteine biosynthesis